MATTSLLLFGILLLKSKKSSDSFVNYITTLKSFFALLKARVYLSLFITLNVSYAASDLFSELLHESCYIFQRTTSGPMFQFYNLAQISLTSLWILQNSECCTSLCNIVFYFYSLWMFLHFHKLCFFHFLSPNGFPFILLLPLHLDLSNHLLKNYSLWILKLHFLKGGQVWFQ